MQKLLLPTVLVASLSLAAWSLAAQGPGSRKAPPAPQALILAPEVGEWTATVKAGGKEYPGTLVVEAGPGGNGIVSHLKASFGSVPFEGRGLEAWDPARGKYTGLWIYSLSPQPLLAEGTWDEATKTRTMRMEVPAAEGKPGKTEWHVTKVVGDDERAFQILGEGPGGERTEMLSIRYVRKK
ncbi:MAG: DUF1579 family protein [Planctomycetota bacterium]|nr:DUF1579 family protein [Planctomycetota bacterium]